MGILKEAKLDLAFYFDIVYLLNKGHFEMVSSFKGMRFLPVTLSHHTHLELAFSCRVPVWVNRLPFTSRQTLTKQFLAPVS